MHTNLQKIAENIKNTDKVLFILCGLPYSGKTYIAQEIIKSAPIVYVSIDNIFHQHGYDWTSNHVPDKDAWTEIFTEAYEKTRRALNASSNVLYDSTNHTRASRDDLRALAESVHAGAQVIFIEVPLSTVHARWEETRVNETRPVINRELLDSTVKAFEAPTSDEHVSTLLNV